MSRPLRSGCTRSRMPPTARETTGRPRRNASRTTRGSPSDREETARSVLASSRRAISGGSSLGIARTRCGQLSHQVLDHGPHRALSDHDQFRLGNLATTARHAVGEEQRILGLLEHADPSHGRLLRQARGRVREGFEVDERREARKGSATGRPLGQIRGAGRHRPDPVRSPKGKQRAPVCKLGERTSPPAPVEPCRGPPVTMQLDHQLGPLRARQPGRGEDHGECLERALGDHHVGPKAPDLGRDDPGKLRVRDHVDEAVPAPSGST